MELRPTYPVTASRLLLRPLGDADVEALVSYRSLEEVCRFVPFDPMDRAAVRLGLTTTWARQQIDGEGQHITLGVELLETGELAGDVMLKLSSELHRSGEVGYVFHPRYGGHGYATEAVHTLLHLAFDQLQLRRIVARVDAENAASARLAARLGMRQEARQIENEWFKGRWGDELDFALLDREWRAQHAGGCPWPPPETSTTPSPRS